MYLRWRTKCLLFLLHCDPTRSQAKQGWFRPAFGYCLAERWNWLLQGWSKLAPRSQRGCFTQEHTRCWVLADIPISTYSRCSHHFGRSAGYSQVLYAARSCREAQPCKVIRGCWAALLPILIFQSGIFGWHRAACPELTLNGKPETSQLPSGVASLLALASPGAVGTSPPRSSERKTENHSSSLLWLLTYFFSIFYNKCSLTGAFP